MNHKFNYDKVKRFIEIDSDSGCKLLSNEYLGYNEKLKIKCRCGDEFFVSFAVFKNNSKRQCNICGHKNGGKENSLEYEEVKKFIEIESKSGCELLSNEYKNNSTNMLLKCHCGDEFETTFSEFKHSNKRQCNACGYNSIGNILKFTYEEVKHYVEVESGSGCKLLSNEYINNSTNMLLQCVCGEEFKTTLSSFRSRKKHHCNKCSIEIRGEKRRLTYDEVKHFIEVESGSGCRLLSKTYINNNSQLIIECSCGNIFQTTYANFQNPHTNKRQCNECGFQITGSKNKLPYDYVKNEIELNDYELLSVDYINNSTKLKVRCNNKHNYFVTFQNFQQGSRCPECSKEHRRISSSKTAYNWFGEFTNLKRYLRGLLGEWKYSSLESHAFCCAITGIHNNSLQIHHLKSCNTIISKIFKELNFPIKDFIEDYTKEELHSISNLFVKQHENSLGVPLDVNIHKLFHKKYGYGDNTPEQFEEFKTRLKEGEFVDFLEENNLKLVI